MTRLIGCIIAMIAVPAQADDTRTWTNLIGTAYVNLGPPLAPGAVASVTFHDEPLHYDDERFELTDLGLNVVIEFTWNAGAGDAITILPPDGYIAVPPTLSPGESAKGLSHIYEYLGG